MKCPIDNRDLLMMDRQGIEIDYCPDCRGVWLDRGELDKLIERSAGVPAATTMPSPRPEPTHRPPEHTDDYDHRKQPGYKKHKKESFLGDLFDF